MFLSAVGDPVSSLDDRLARPNTDQNLCVCLCVMVCFCVCVCAQG